MRGICCLLLVVFNVLVPFRFASYADLVFSPSDALGQAAESLEPSEPEIGGGTSDGKVFPMLYAGPVNRWLRRLTLIAYIMMLLLTVLIIRSCYLLIQNLP